jgi:hypothetical protein
MPITRHDSPASGATGKIAKTKIKPIRKPDFRRQHPREKNAARLRPIQYSNF